MVSADWPLDGDRTRSPASDPNCRSTILAVCPIVNKPTQRTTREATAMHSPYDDLPKNQANYAPLTPLTFIERAAYVYPDKLSVVHGTQSWTWREPYARCRRLASA